MGISRNKWHKTRKTGAKQFPIRTKRNFELGRQPANTKLGERRVHNVRCRGAFVKYRALRLDHGNYSWPGEAVTRKSRILGVVYNATSNEIVRTNTLVQGDVIQIDATPFKNWYKKHYGVKLGQVKVESKKGDSKNPEKKTGTKGKMDVEKKNQLKKTVTKEETKKEETKKEVTKKEVTKKEVAKKEVTKEETKDKKGNSVKKITKRKTPNNAIKKKWVLRNKTRVLEAALSDQFEKGKLYAKISSSPGQIGNADGYVLEGEELAFYLRKLNLKKKK